MKNFKKKEIFFSKTREMNCAENKYQDTEGKRTKKEERDRLREEKSNNKAKKMFRTINNVGVGSCRIYSVAR